MTVIASRYLSARGINVLALFFVIALSLTTVPSCGDRQREAISEEEFTEIYGDILYLGELYRAHPFELHLALDSMMEYRNIDTMMVYEAVNRYAQRTYDVAQLHAGIIERLETLAREDSARNAPPSEDVTAPPGSLDRTVDTRTSADTRNTSADTRNTSADTGSSEAGDSGNRRFR